MISVFTSLACLIISISLFFINETPTTEIYTLSLHDALPISQPGQDRLLHHRVHRGGRVVEEDRKSTRLNSSHVAISYAVFCLKKKKKELNTEHKLTSLSTCNMNSYIKTCSERRTFTREMY